MRTRISVLVLVVVVLVAVVVGCGSRSPYVGTWVNRFSMGESRMTLNGNGTGSANGFVFGSGATFTWREDGDHVVIENWQGGGSRYNYAKISPDGDGLYASSPRSYLNYLRSKE